MAVVAVAVGGTWAAARLEPLDLTAERSATLSEETKRVVEALDAPVRITAFFERNGLGRAEAATLLARYRRHNRRISWRILDPARVPGEAQRLGVTHPGSSAIEALDSSGDVEVAPYTIEIDVTSALARLQRRVSHTVCFASGHGERSVENGGPDGVSRAAVLLRENGYLTETVNLLARPSVPSDCDALFVAAPSSEWRQEVVRAVRSWTRSSGKLFVAADPESQADPSALVRPWGLSFARGVVVERDPSAHLPGDPISPIVADYAEASAAVRGLGPTFYPGVMEVVVDEPDGRDGLDAFAAAQTSSSSYLERSPLEGGFDPDVDSPGPVTVGAVADESRVVDDRVERTRILAWGDADFLTNTFLDQAANANLVVQAADWLTQDEPLVAAVPSFPSPRTLELTEARSRYLLWTTAGGVPLLFLLLGAFVWAVRRGR